MQHLVHQDRALKITPESIPTITEALGRNTAQVSPYINQYYVACLHIDCTRKMIISEKDFKWIFEFTEPESSTQFATVKER